MTTDAAYHVIEEVLLVTGNVPGTEIVLDYSEELMQMEVMFENLPTVDRRLFESKNNKLSADIIRNYSNSMTIDGNTITVLLSSK